VRRKTVGDGWRFGVGGLDVCDVLSGTHRRQHDTDAGVQRRRAPWSVQRLIFGVVNAYLIGDNSKKFVLKFKNSKYKSLSWYTRLQLL
jgi:hypothetical protein